MQRQQQHAPLLHEGARGIVVSFQSYASAEVALAHQRADKAQAACKVAEDREAAAQLQAAAWKASTLASEAEAQAALVRAQVAEASSRADNMTCAALTREVAKLKAAAAAANRRAGHGEHALAELRHLMTCCITLDLAVDPVMNRSDGRVYERESLLQALAESEVSPVNRQPTGLENIQNIPFSLTLQLHALLGVAPLAHQERPAACQTPSAFSPCISKAHALLHLHHYRILIKQHGHDGVAATEQAEMAGADHRLLMTSPSATPLQKQASQQALDALIHEQARSFARASTAANLELEAQQVKNNVKCMQEVQALNPEFFAAVLVIPALHTW